MQCNSCSHKNVCEFRDGYNETLCKLTDDIEIPSIFKVNLECSHFDALRMINASDMFAYPHMDGCHYVPNGLQKIQPDLMPGTGVTPCKVQG